MDWWTILLGLGIVAIIAIIVIFILIAVLINTIFLKISLGFFKKSEHKEFGTVFITALIMALIGWIPCIGCILSWVIINSRHKTGFGTAIVIWLITFILEALVVYAIYFALTLLGII